MSPRERLVLERYLARYAEPEADYAAYLPGAWSQVLVVPALAEAPTFLQGFEAAITRARGRVLVIVVVNAAAQAKTELHAANLALVKALHHAGTVLAEPAEGLCLVEAQEMDLLVVDRGQAPRFLPPKQGVGLARKIGFDLALGLFVGGALETSILAGTDADATLPEDYFLTLNRYSDAGIIAAPYRHAESESPRLHQATCAYELSLRYYVLGLSFAQSPYALHTIGSTLSIPALAYAQVRGVPKRTAGEDFHLVNKALKVGYGARPALEPVVLQSRWSGRVLFGTGPAVTRIDRDWEGPDAFQLLHPDAFTHLGIVQRGVLRVAQDGRVDSLYATLSELPTSSAEIVLQFLTQSRLLRALEVAATASKDPDVRQRRVCVSFDGLQSLRLIHRLRDGGLGRVPWRQALGQASFARLEPADLEAARRWSRQAEAGLPRRTGLHVS